MHTRFGKVSIRERLAKVVANNRNASKQQLREAIAAEKAKYYAEYCAEQASRGGVEVMDFGMGKEFGVKDGQLLGTEQLTNVFLGRTADTGEQIGSNEHHRHRDTLTYESIIAAHKDLSILCHHPDPEIRQKARDTFENTVRKSVADIVQRIGTHQRMNGQDIREITQKCICLLSFDYVNRYGEEHAHCHIEIPNTTMTADGKIVAIDGMQLFVSGLHHELDRLSDNRLIGAYQAAGLAYGIDKHDRPRLLDVPSEAIKESSKRSSDILQMQNREACRIGERVPLARSECRKHGLPYGTTATLIRKGDNHTVTVVTDSGEQLEVSGRMSNNRAWKETQTTKYELTSKEANEQAARHAAAVFGGKTAEELEAIRATTRRELADEREKWINEDTGAKYSEKAKQTATGTRENVGDVGRWQLALERVTARQSTATEQQIVTEYVAECTHTGKVIDPQEAAKQFAEQVEQRNIVDAGNGRYTSHNLVKIEKEIDRICATKTTGGVIKDAAAQLERLQEAERQRPGGRPLTDDQAEVVRQLLSSNGKVFSLRGKAGAGKSTAMAIATKLLEQNNTTVICLASSRNAARGLGEKTGAPYLTISQLRYRIETGQIPLDAFKNTVILLDEAGMTSAADLHFVLSLPHAKIGLIHDNRQTDPVAAGAGTEYLHDRLQQQGNAAELTQIMRCRTVANGGKATTSEVAIFEKIASNEVAEGLRMMHDAGLVVELPPQADGRYDRNRDEAMLVARAAVDFDRTGEVKDGWDFIVAPTNKAVAELNDAIREVEIMRGNIDLTTQREFTITYEDKTETDAGMLQHSTRMFAVGDYIIPTMCYKEAGLEKNERLVIEKIEGSTIIAKRLTDDKTFSLDTKQFNAIDYGYSSTIHKAEGMTVHRCGALDGDTANIKALLTALTRTESYSIFYTPNYDNALIRAEQKVEHPDLTQLPGSGKYHQAEQERIIKAVDKEITANMGRKARADNYIGRVISAFSKDPATVPGANEQPARLSLDQIREENEKRARENEPKIIRDQVMLFGIRSAGRDLVRAVFGDDGSRKFLIYHPDDGRKPFIVASETSRAGLLYQTDELFLKSASKVWRYCARRVDNWWQARKHGIHKGDKVMLVDKKGVERLHEVKAVKGKYIVFRATVQDKQTGKPKQIEWSVRAELCRRATPEDITNSYFGTTAGQHSQQTGTVQRDANETHGTIDYAELDRQMAEQRARAEAQRPGIQKDEKPAADKPGETAGKPPASAQDARKPGQPTAGQTEGRIDWRNRTMTATPERQENIRALKAAVNDRPDLTTAERQKLANFFAGARDQNAAHRIIIQGDHRGTDWQIDAARAATSRNAQERQQARERIEQRSRTREWQRERSDPKHEKTKAAERIANDLKAVDQVCQVADSHHHGRALTK